MKGFQMKLQRLTDSGQETMGRLEVNGSRFCNTLEDTYRDIKIPGDTRIPAGKYKVIPRFYGKFFEAYKKRWNHRFGLELENVPNYTHVLIHTGNNHLHTAGCILVGSAGTKDSLTGSRGAYSRLYDEISPAVEVGDCWIEVCDEES